MAKNDGYLGNQNLRRTNIPIEYTPEQVEEFVKCYKDPVYFIKNYVKIITLDDGMILLKLWKFQEKMVKTIIDNRFSVAKLGRQVR